LTDAKIITDEALDLLFREARTHRAWLGKPVSDSLLQAVYELAKMGPTEANMQCMRIVFVKSKEAKDRLAPYMDKGNLEKTMTAPATAIIAYDEEFYERMKDVQPDAKDPRSWYAGKDNSVKLIRSSSLGGAYVIMAARALGLDCGPMSGFNADGIAKEFFDARACKVNFLINLGYGDASQLKPRLPRLGFDDVCQIV